MRVVILMAGMSRRLWDYSREPKCLLEIGGSPLVHRYLDALRAFDGLVYDVTLVVGYKAAHIQKRVQAHSWAHRVRYVHNDRYDKGSILSLQAGLGEAGEATLLMDGDVYFEPELLNRLLEFPADNVFLVDTASTNTGEEIMLGADAGKVARVGRGMRGRFGVYGEWVGFLRMSAAASRTLARLVNERVNDGLVAVGYEDLLDEMVGGTAFRVCLVGDLKWTEIDFPEDVATAKRLAGG